MHQTMLDHPVGSREEWLAARLQLLEGEKAHTRRGDELAKLRQALPWVRLEKTYYFESDAGRVTLADLFGGRSQLLVYHFMFGPDYEAGCPSCSAIADSFNGSVPHLVHHDVSFSAVSRAPLAKLHAYKRRMHWDFPWASSYGSDFNYDFHVSRTQEQQQSGTVEYNYRPMDVRPALNAPADSWVAQIAESAGTDIGSYMREGPGLSAFVRNGDDIYHTYSAYGRGLDAVWGMYQWLDRAPLGRNEDGEWWFRRHDEYQPAPAS